MCHIFFTNKQQCSTNKGLGTFQKVRFTLFVLICGYLWGEPGKFWAVIPFLSFPLPFLSFCSAQILPEPGKFWALIPFLSFPLPFLFFSFFFLSSSFSFVFVWPKFCRNLANFGPSFLFFPFLFLFFPFVRPKFCRNPANFGPSFLFCPFLFLFFSFLFLFFPFLFLFFLSSSFSFFLFGPNFAGTRQILGRHSIADEEAVQFGTLNLLYSIFQSRGCPKPEGCHGLWNSFKRAVSSSELMGTWIKIKMHLPVQSGISVADFMNIQEGAFLFLFFLFVRPKFCRNPANFGPSFLFFFFLFLFFPFLFLFFPFVRPKFCRNPANFGPSFLFCPFLFLSFSFLSSSFSFLSSSFSFLSSSFSFLFVRPKFCRNLANFGPSFLFFFFLFLFFPCVKGGHSLKVDLVCSGFEREWDEVEDDEDWGCLRGLCSVQVFILLHLIPLRRLSNPEQTKSTFKPSQFNV